MKIPIPLLGGIFRIESQSSILYPQSSRWRVLPDSLPSILAGDGIHRTEWLTGDKISHDLVEIFFDDAEEHIMLLSR